MTKHKGDSGDRGRTVLNPIMSSAWARGERVREETKDERNCGSNVAEMRGASDSLRRGSHGEDDDLCGFGVRGTGAGGFRSGPFGDDIDSFPACDAGGWMEETLVRQRHAVNALVERHHDELLREFTRRLQMCGTVMAAAANIGPPELAGVLPRVETFDFDSEPPSVPVSPHLGGLSAVATVRQGKQAVTENPVFDAPNQQSSRESAVRAREAEDDLETNVDHASQHTADVWKDARDCDSGRLERDVERQGSFVSSSIPGVDDVSDVEVSNWKRLGGKYEIFFEVGMATVIVFNALSIAAERQYESFDTAYYAVQFPRAMPSAETWPGARSIFDIAEMVFGCVFCGELLIMLTVYRCRYFTLPWHIFDLMIVFFWVLSQFHGLFMATSLNPTLLRLARLFRLVRLLRLIRIFSLFDSLFLLIKSVMSSMGVLFWAVLLLFVVIMVVALLANHFLEDYVRDLTKPVEARLSVFRQWGSVTRAVETMFEITLGNWGPPVVLLQNEVSEWWVLFFLAYKLIVGFAVVQVITSVFIQQTFKVVARDEDVMMKEKQAEGEVFLKSIGRLFAEIDSSGDGKISREELEQCFVNQRFAAWFSALDIDISEASQVFSSIDTGEGEIDYEEFVSAIRSMKGAARSLDILRLSKSVRRIEELVLSKEEQPPPCPQLPLICPQLPPICPQLPPIAAHDISEVSM
eukprot:TRINITY_DN21721_c0_g2_i1.p1 TRINITY_DN21721_c0_g2~~TRINITY_DN21721_c0_g2_i1.p1  ORF type:complete len:712 (-),score=139.32 TRINITY_DN21721_c0_g2_i1:82-2160(-)